MKEKLANAAWRVSQIIDSALIITTPISHIVASVIVIIGLAFYAVEVTDFKSFTESWQVQPITDMIFVNGTTCPATYTIFREAVWPGAVVHCDCRLSQYADGFKTVRDVPCTAIDNANGCVDGPAAPAVTLTRWRGKLLCVQRGGPTALTRLRFNTTTMSCGSSTLKPCGSGANTTICVGKNDTCPLNWAIISSDALASDKDVLLNGTLRFRSNFTAMALPITHIAITEGAPCSVISRRPSRADQLNILLSKSLACQKHDSRYIQLDTLSETDLFLGNKVPAKYITEVSNTITWRLSIRLEIPWNDDCSTNRRFVFANRGDIDNVYFTQIAMTVTTLVRAVLMGFVIQLVYIVFCKWVYVWKPSKLNKKHVRYMDRYVQVDLCCDCLLKIINVTTVIVCIVYTALEQVRFDRLANAGCTQDQMTIDTFAGISRSFSQTTSILNYLILIYEFAEGILILVLFIGTMVKCCTTPEQESSSSSKNISTDQELKDHDITPVHEN